MFKTVKRKITTADICGFGELTKKYLLDEAIVKVEDSHTGYYLRHEM